MADARRYEPLGHVSVPHALAESATGHPDRVARAILGAAPECEDSMWVESAAVSLALCGVVDVRRAARVSRGHLVQRFGELSGPALAVVLERLEREESLKGTVSDVRDDVEVFG